MGRARRLALDCHRAADGAVVVRDWAVVGESNRVWLLDGRRSADPKASASRLGVLPDTVGTWIPTNTRPGFRFSELPGGGTLAAAHLSDGTWLMVHSQPSGDNVAYLSRRTDSSIAASAAPETPESADRVRVSPPLVDGARELDGARVCGVLDLPQGPHPWLVGDSWWYRDSRRYVWVCAPSVTGRALTDGRIVASNASNPRAVRWTDRVVVVMHDDDQKRGSGVIGRPLRAVSSTDMSAWTSLPKLDPNMRFHEFDLAADPNGLTLAGLQDLPALAEVNEFAGGHAYAPPMALVVLRYDGTTQTWREILRQRDERLTPDSTVALVPPTTGFPVGRVILRYGSAAEFVLQELPANK